MYAIEVVMLNFAEYQLFGKDDFEAPPVEWVVLHEAHHLLHLNDGPHTKHKEISTSFLDGCIASTLLHSSPQP
jgi:fatty-acid desaturase